MLNFLNESAYFGLALSLAAYFLGWILQKKTKIDAFNPLLISMIVVAAFLALTGMDIGAYQRQTSVLSYLLTPATVCLAVPLYKQLGVLKKNAAAVLVSVAVGAVSAMASVLAVCFAFGASHEIFATLLPKSVTTAIGMGVAEELGGIADITVAVICITGVVGALVAKPLCRLLRVTHPVAVGLAFGVSSHSLGTAKALEIGEIEGAMSGLALVITGIFTVALSPLFAMIL